MIAPPNTMSLYELQSSIGFALEEAFPYQVWVTAEIHSMTVNRNGHVYLELIEKDSDTESNSIKAQAKGVIWKNQASAILTKFFESTNNRLSAGMNILILASVSFHPIYGLSLNISDIDPTYTLGDMERQKRATIEQLKKDGVWDMNRTLETPLVPLRIAVVSSATAAGYRDFIKELERYPYRFSVSLYDATMQGTGAEDSIVEALGRIADKAEEYDVVALIRGGGSTTDLNCFNSYRIASHIAQFPLPVLTGIGHDRDTSVADMVAHLQLKTPTATAGWIAERVDDFNGSLADASRQLVEICSTLSSKTELELLSLRTSVHTSAMSAIASSSEGLTRKKSELNSLSTTGISLLDNSLIHAAELLSNRIESVFSNEDKRLQYALSLTENFSPRRLLGLGYSIARKGVKAVRSIDDLTENEEFRLEMSDGEINAVVKQKLKRTQI